ncbi:MAG: hypothetical protein AAF939_16445 [Planctomycetota bacterium]
MTQINLNRTGIALVTVAIFWMTGQTNADFRIQRIHAAVIEIECLADANRADIKSQFRGCRGYGRLVGANSVVDSKASQICRRIKRKCDYRSLCRDLERLEKSICKLRVAYDEVIHHIVCAGGILDPCMIRIGDRICQMEQLVRVGQVGHAIQGLGIQGHATQGQLRAVRPGTIEPSLRPAIPVSPSLNGPAEFRHPSSNLLRGIFN